ncbi:DNA metabolism protein [Lithospermum erythrorhizon]|uniref:DNA metabolism protein n=1 Tax=Lithospermum erythrorhizon TaxID=34254 RepID=A0AAV3RDP0_LITER
MKESGDRMAEDWLCQQEKQDDDKVLPFMDEDGFPLLDITRDEPSSSACSLSSLSTPTVVCDERHTSIIEKHSNDILSCNAQKRKGNRSLSIKENDTQSFASDFYNSGTDCSSLLFVDNMEEIKNPESQKKQKLKQSNLFQLWGLSPQSLLSDKPNMHPQEEKNSGSIEGAMKNKNNNNQNQHRSHVCPFYKKMPGTPFTVDAFRYGKVQDCAAYFLSHFHADHYGGLTKKWSHGPIYATALTARLVKMCLYVDPFYIHPLEFGKEYVIEGVRVTMLEANHCPGAALIHFLLPNGACYLHTGDFRASKSLQSYPILLNHRVNVLYLDTTYCNPKYRFPPKEEVLKFAVRVVRNHLKNHPKTLIIVGAYSIGKECVYLEISKALGVKIHATASRRRILQSYGWPQISDNLCTNGRETPLHILPISSLKDEHLQSYLLSFKSQFSTVLAFRPTGWTFSETIGHNLDLIKPRTNGSITIYGVPYSEHSSFDELQEFVKFLRPEKIIPTVNVGSAVNRDKMQSYFRQWLSTK